MKHALRSVAVLLALLLPPIKVWPQETTTMNSNYRIYDSAGKPATFAQVIEAVAASEVVFVGEIHDDPTAHAVELQLLQGAYAHRAAGQRNSPPLVLSLEMFERDVQPVVDEYLADLILERHFLAASRPWKNYQTDYRPLVEFAREKKLRVVAANAPERYVNRVGRLGRDALKSLPTATLTWLAPLPYGAASTAYADKFKAVMTGGMPGGAHGNPYLLDAQALRDATMAYSIAEALKQPALVLHVNGNFHSEGRLGTPEQLRALRPQTRMLVVTVLPARGDNAQDAKQLGALGDFVFVAESAPSGRF